MASNETDPTLRGSRAVNVHPGIANPTPSSNQDQDPYTANFVTDPTVNVRGAGAGSDFRGYEDAARAMNPKSSSGVVEARPGIIESSNIDPLNEDSNKDLPGDGWANATRAPGSGVGNEETITSRAVDTASSAANTATGAAQMVYGHLVGDEQTKQAGREAVYGKSQ